MAYAILWLFLAVTRGIPITTFIIWLEVNYYGQTMMPEYFTGGMIAMYICGRCIIWRSISGINISGNRKVTI